MLRIGVATAGRPGRDRDRPRPDAGRRERPRGRRRAPARPSRSCSRRCPKGVRIVPYYDRATFVRRVIRTVETNLLEGEPPRRRRSLRVPRATFRAGLIVASAIPLSMLLAFTGMVRVADLGEPHEPRRDRLRADRRRRGRPRRERRSAALRARGARQDGPAAHGRGRSRGASGRSPSASGSSSSSTFRSSALGGIEGKMFKPMAWTVVFALAGSLLLTLTLTPVLASLFLKKTGHEHEPRFVGQLRVAATSAASTSASSGAPPSWLPPASLVVAGALRRLDGSAASSSRGSTRATSRSAPSARPRSASSEVAASTGRIERVLKKFPEVITVVSRSGSPELATDVMGIELGRRLRDPEAEGRVDLGPDQGRARREDGDGPRRDRARRRASRSRSRSRCASTS